MSKVHRADIQLEMGGDRPMFVTQFTHRIDMACETSQNFPSLTDPECEVYTVAELLARHEKGLLTNLNIGKQAAYPEYCDFDSRDSEKDFGLEPTDREHLASELEEANRPLVERLKKEKAEKDEKERKEKEDAAFAARAASEGWTKSEKGEEGKTAVVP